MVSLWRILPCDTFILKHSAKFRPQSSVYPNGIHQYNRSVDFVTNNGIAVREAQLIPLEENEEAKKHRSRMIQFLVVTAALACVFLVIKYFEYSHKLHVGTLPGNFYDFAEW